MTRYLIKTDKHEKKTHLVSLGNPLERIGLIYTDFLVRLDVRDITSEEIVDPSENKAVGQIVLYKKKDIITVRLNGKEVASLNRDGEYSEEGSQIPFKRYERDNLSTEKYERLLSAGLDHAYSLGEQSALSHIFCFERGRDLASIVYGRNKQEGLSTVLKGLVLSLAKRIESQDYVFEFMNR